MTVGHWPTQAVRRHSECLLGTTNICLPVSVVLSSSVRGGSDFRGLALNGRNEPQKAQKRPGCDFDLYPRRASIESCIHYYDSPASPHSSSQATAPQDATTTLPRRFTSPRWLPSTHNPNIRPIPRRQHRRTRATADTAERGREHAHDALVSVMRDGKNIGS
jgi:hypothetical protein